MQEDKEKDAEICASDDAWWRRSELQMMNVMSRELLGPKQKGK